MKSGSGNAREYDFSSLETVLSGEAQRMLGQQSAQVLAKYGTVRPELEDLYDAVSYSVSKVNAVLKTARKQLDPLRDRFDFTSKAGLDDLSLFRFINNVGGGLTTFVYNSYTRLHQMELYLNVLLPVLNATKTPELTSVIMAEESGGNLMLAAREEYHSTVVAFEKLLGGIYLGTRNEYKKLRKKFLGGTALQPDEDNMEDQLMLSFFGMKPPKKEAAGPAVALIDNNCILTQLFLDIADNLPRYYEKVTPVLKRGKLTGKTTTTKFLDNGEVEDWAETMISISDPTYWNYINAPSELTSNILAITKAFQTAYARVAPAIHALVVKADLIRSDEDRRFAIEDPNTLVKQYNRINFLSIRPSAEDIAPRTKMDTDMAIARNKLFLHLKETLTALSGMSHFEQATEDYAILRTKEAIELKKAMDEILKTEEQKNLARNIQDDNEFYLGKSGNLGSLGSEREPAPKISYEDVVGASFITAKQHIEEVVKVASHPQIMRLSAPRGDVKSNIMLIGPYGCGKSEMAKAIGADKRIIGFNVSTADMLTAYMHESVKNVKRMYDLAKDMRRSSRYTKPVGILMDEFDRLFTYGEGVHAAYDGSRMTGVLQEMMDGIVGYEGVFLVALTNLPKSVPEAVLRRFKYIDVVGQLSQEERAQLFKHFLTRGLPIDPSVTQENYMAWSEIMVGAPGDVIGKVADEIHFKFMHELVEAKPEKVKAIEKALNKRLRDRESKKQDFDFIRKALGSYKTITAEEISSALETVIKQPQVKMQIEKAVQVYKDSEDILKGLSKIGKSGLGFGGDVRKKSDLWGKD